MAKHIHIHVHGATRDAGTAHDPKNGQFTSGGGGGSSSAAPPARKKFQKGDLIKGRWTAPITYVGPVSEAYAKANDLIGPHSWIRNPYGTKQAEPDTSLKKHNPATA